MSQKSSFWQALLVTVVIFALGVLLGVVLENWRNSKVDFLYKTSEVDLLDVRVQDDIYTLGKFNCNKAIDENIKFADRIYSEASLLERYQKASVITTENFAIEHKKYDILRTTLLLNSLKIKEKCNTTYHDVVYFYKYHTADINMVAKEGVYSRLLGELKDKEGNSILLVPIATDGNLSSVNLIIDKYNISENELPTILIDEKIKVTELKNINDLLKYFK